MWLVLTCCLTELGSQALLSAVGSVLRTVEGWLPALQGPEQMIIDCPVMDGGFRQDGLVASTFKGLTIHGRRPEIGDGELFNHTSWEGGA